MDNKNEVRQAIIHIEMLQESMLINSAVMGCSARELYILGEENIANKNFRHGEQEAKLCMEIASHIESSIRSGDSLKHALTYARLAGFNKKLNELVE